MNPGASSLPEPELHSTLNRIRTILCEYRNELETSEQAFQAWQAEWDDKQREIDQTMNVIESRLRPEPTRPQLAVVHAD